MLNRIKSIVESNRTDIKFKTKEMQETISAAQHDLRPEAFRAQVRVITDKYMKDIRKIRQDSLAALDRLQKRLGEDDFAGIAYKPQTTVPAELLEEMNLVCSSIEKVPHCYIEDFAVKAFRSGSMIAMEKVKEMAAKQDLKVHFPDADEAAKALDDMFTVAANHVKMYDPNSKSPAENTLFNDISMDKLFGRYEAQFNENQCFDLSVKALADHEAEKNYRIKFEPLHPIYREKQDKAYTPGVHVSGYDGPTSYRSAHEFVACVVDDDDATDIHDAPVAF